MNFVNLTPHDVVLIVNDEKIVIPTSGYVARAVVTTVHDSWLHIDGKPVEVVHNEYGATENLPEPENGVGYIVSSLAAQGCKHRDDVFVPDDTVRDEKGRIVGCRRLARI